VAHTVAIVGAGPIGRATAAYLAHHGTAVALWSPSGKSAQALTQGMAHGRGRLAYEGELKGVAQIDILADAAELRTFDVVLIALPGHAYPAVLPQVIPHLHAAQTVIVSGALSLAPLWIHERAGKPGARPVVASWGTTLATARHIGARADAVYINTLRSVFEVAAIPATASDQALALCRALFGDRFVAAPNILATALLNVNPVAHAAEVLPNLTRIEKRENWPLFDCLTPAAARIGEAIDAERQAIARGFGFHVRSIHEHTHLSYHVPLASYAEMAAAIHAKYGGPPGPVTLDHRYILEDVPYGLAFYEALACIVGVAAPNLSAAITLISTAYGRDLRRDNLLLAALNIEDTARDALLARCAGAP
jgi:opine dehydrogenase